MKIYSKDEARTEIEKLVANFKSQEAMLENAPEAMIENNYIRPLFRFLNWNVDNEDLTPAQWEFVLQDTQRTGKRPDYRLQLDGQWLLFMDAKQVKYRMSEPRWLNQVYAYAYSTQNNPRSRKVDFAILTDFQEFVVLDCTLYAAQPEVVNNFRVLDWGCNDYISQFDTLWELFERNNVMAASKTRGTDQPGGLWSRHLTPKQVKANRIPPDKTFLDALDDEETGWRIKLAKDMKKHNPQLDGTVLTAAVQLLIDRLIFVKVLSDREIEEDYLSRLADTVGQSGLRDDDFGWFVACRGIFEKLNQFYDGSVFESRPELESVVVSNRAVHDVIRDLQPENSPYNFSVPPVETLGTIYERFLGRVIRTTDHRVKIEGKPEVRKAGGVYYTPQYIVDYIVQNTVGKILKKCKTPGDVSKLRILDPACGSGSFLLGAYSALIEWHIRYYSDKERLTKKDRAVAYYDSDGSVRLTSRLKRKILLDNIYGVDIDSQAIEVTQLSLSLKALEDTRQGELYEERTLFKQTVLPDLHPNIKCGNSIIGPGYFTGQMFAEKEELLRVKPFDWEHEFSEVLMAGGFDAVIGNPPWGADIDKSVRAYLAERFTEVADFESSQYFIMKSISLLDGQGMIGMIIPNTFALNVLARRSRQKILESASITAMLDLSEENVFAGPNVRSMILFLDRGTTGNCLILELRKGIAGGGVVRSVSQDELKSSETWKVFFKRETPLSLLVARLIENNPSLADYCDVKQGYIPYRTTTLTRRLGRVKAQEIVKKRLWHSTKREGPEYSKELQGMDVGRYSLGWSGVWVRYGEWVATYLPTSVFSGPRILVREITGRSPRILLATYTEDVFVHNPSVLAVLPRPNSVSPKFILGVLNSRLMSTVFTAVAPKSKKGLFPKIIITDARRLPFPRVKLVASRGKARHDKMVQFVESMLALHQHKAKAKTQAEQEQIQRQIDAIDRKIDDLVYELYGLTDEEIAIVERETTT